MKTKLHGRLLLFITFTVLSRNLAKGIAPNRTSTLGNLQYGYFAHMKVQYPEAVEGCRQWNSSLASIKNEFIQRHIENQTRELILDDCLINNRAFYYIGLRLVGNTWKWLDNSTVEETNFTNWQDIPIEANDNCTRQPNGMCSGRVGEGFVQIFACQQHRHFGKWFDKKSVSSWYYICEKPFAKEESGTKPTNLARTQLVTEDENTKIPSNISKVTDILIIENEVTTVPTFVKKTLSQNQEQELVNLDKCLNALLAPPGYQAENFLKKCNLEKLFGRTFSIRNWEDNVSKSFARSMFLQSYYNQKRISNFISQGVIIQLYKFSGHKDWKYLNQSLNNSLNISLFESSKDSFLLERKDLDKLQRPYVIVAAAFQPVLLQANNLTVAHPATTEYRISDVDKLELGKTFRFLPQNSNILSLSVFAANRTGNQSVNLQKESIPVSHSFDLENDFSVNEIERNTNQRVVLGGIKYSCVYLNTTSTYTWSDEGCFVVKSNGANVMCKCNHTTSFGVLLAVRVIQVPALVDTILLVLEIVSIISLALTTTFLIWLRKKLHNDRTIIQINLSLSLLLLHFFFVIGSAATNTAVLCEVCAFFSQLFTLSSAVWMLNEGIVLYLKTCKNALKFNKKKVFPILITSAWGLTLLYVVICAAVGFPLEKYLDYSEVYTNMRYKNESTTEESAHKYLRCWLSNSSGMIYSVIVPLLLIFIASFGILIIISRSINAMNVRSESMRPSQRQIQLTSTSDQQSQVNTVQHSCSTKPTAKNVFMEGRKPNQKNNKLTRFALAKNISVTLRAIVTLVPALGIPWFFAFLVNIPSTEVIFITIHGVINGLQGVFIFIIYVVRNEQLRRVLRRKWFEIPSQKRSLDTLSRKSTKGN
ncbi:unnamed protein product [Clavelina lepadiformis]|uniref:Uncharacterized protein n=1 Tax=Clavelina lepadiformis TaxID=159417 RepID=A0ABP0FF65_CLALP